MTNIIRLKRSSTAAKVPGTADLQLRELAINTHDGRLFLKKDNGTPTIIDVTALNATGSIGFLIDGGGIAITNGLKGSIAVPFACTIVSWTLIADTSGSLTLDIWKSSFASYPATAAQSITGSAKPAIISDVKATSAALTGWTTSIAAGDILAFNVDAASAITRVSIGLTVTRI